MPKVNEIRTALFEAAPEYMKDGRSQLRGAEHPRPERLAYHEAALREIEEMREHDAEGQ